MKASRARQEQKHIEDDDERARQESSEDGEAGELAEDPIQPEHSAGPAEESAGVGQVKERGASNEPNDEDLDDEDDGVESEAGQDEVIQMQVCRVSWLAKWHG